ncbi:MULTISPECIES: GlpM family protein [unclassified Sporolactobacillus]|uniref:GlpM family protein n=1 Tax=unclassified Sporolactobacillus TaxID=2628533 RepID=UPI00236870AE|nr:GlpM family protein [Sporolactobacillus sp. CQH2019]MDD9149815.1 GlpM family protein [Sporolactobacillus sp. CQH2019]
MQTVLDDGLKFIIGGTLFVLMSYFSKSKFLFLSGVITFIPVMTLINMRMQMKYMDLKEFRATEFNAVFGAVGAVVLILSVFILTNWFKPVYAAFIAAVLYIIYMLLCKHFL